MTYEEKLDLILKAISEAKKSTRKDHYTKLYYTADNGLKDLKLSEIHDILLQLQDDEKIIKIRDIPTKLKSLHFKINDNLEGAKDSFLIDAPEEFTIWYETYIFENISRIENIDWLNLLKIFDVVIDIEQELQIISANAVYIDSLPQLVKFSHLFPQDNIGTRRTYQDYRIQGVDFLKKRGVVREYRYIDTQDGGYGKIKVVVDIIKFKDFSIRINNEYKRRLRKQAELEKNGNNGKKKKTQKEKLPKVESETDWPKDFKWDGKDFVFGEYGSISFISSDRKHILKVLTDKKGGWATINELKGNKDAGYVRSTIKQIEDRLPKEAREHIKIVSTQDDDSKEKPNTGAYRIKVLP